MAEMLDGIDHWTASQFAGGDLFGDQLGCLRGGDFANLLHCLEQMNDTAVISASNGSESVTDLQARG
jgi:hypothetical protein